MPDNTSEEALLHYLENIQKRTDAREQRQNSIDFKSTDLLALLAHIGFYFDRKAHEDGSTFEKINHLYHKLYLELSERVFGSKLDTITKAMAIGKFVEILDHFGLPKSIAYSAVGDWLNLSAEKVRHSNTDWKRYAADGDTSSRVSGFNMMYMENMVQLLDSASKPFTSIHPMAQKAFQSTECFIRLAWENTR